MASNYNTAAFVALAALHSVSATAIPFQYPEVIPGPGQPSLASLNLTSAQLYEMPFPDLPTNRFKARAAGTQCGPQDNYYTNVSDIIACYQWVKALDAVTCSVNANSTIRYCLAGDAQLFGWTTTGKKDDRYCNDVAKQALYIIDGCTRPDQSCAGQRQNSNDTLVVAAQGPDTG